MLDPEIVQALVKPVRVEGELTEDEDDLLTQVAQGRPIKAIAASQGTTPEAVNDAVEAVLPQAGPGRQRRPGGRPAAACACCSRRSSTARSRARRSAASCPAAWPRSCAPTADAVGRTERLTVTVLMSDVRGYSGIAEHADPTVLAGQLSTHRRGDEHRHPRRGAARSCSTWATRSWPSSAPRSRRRTTPTGPLRRPCAMHQRQDEVNVTLGRRGPRAFGLGIGLSTGDVAAALLGSDERLEYTVVGDTVNLAQRLQSSPARRARPCSARPRSPA